MLQPVVGTFLYFAYGSNMCTKRLQAADRTPSAVPVAVARLPRYELRFHKRSRKQGDGSGKANAYETGNDESVIWGVVFRIANGEREDLGRVEGEGRGYACMAVTVFERNSDEHATALTFVATNPSDLDDNLRPFDWYVQYVLAGAWQHDLPADYIKKWIVSQEWDRDPNDAQRSANIQVCC